jgi:carbamoyl-phosphate synthase small subunit
MEMQARLLLEDGTLFTGKSFGGNGDSSGEVVFHTGMTGYQEILSDPSYCGQIVTMTYPLIGNYGINRDDFEALRPALHGFVVKKHEPLPSNWRAQHSIDYLLKEYEIIGISDIDTRMLTRKLRVYGAMNGLLSTGNKSVFELKEQLDAMPVIRDQVSRVSTKQTFSYPGSKEHIVLVDFGFKAGILRELTERGCRVTIVPHDTTSEQIRILAPDGILLSNGPGDPQDVMQGVRMVSELLGEYPILGICLGHQLFALACGADTSKLKYGHHGANHPVKDLFTNTCWITSQNHNYTVTEDSLEGTDLTVTHININDGTIEGLKHKQYPAFSVQFHPEASPGPNDSNGIFGAFIQMIGENKANLSSSGSSRGALPYAQTY